MTWRVMPVMPMDPCLADAISPTFKDVPSFGQTKACNAVSSPLANVQGCAGSPCTSRKMSGHQRCKSDGHSPRKERKQQRRMLHELHRCMAQSGLVAFSFSASALQRRMDSLAKLDEADCRSPNSRVVVVELLLHQIHLLCLQPGSYLVCSARTLCTVWPWFQCWCINCRRPSASHPCGDINVLAKPKDWTLIQHPWPSFGL